MFREAWPSFAHNGLGWFGAGGNVDNQIQAIFTSGDLDGAPVYTFHAWPLLWSTVLITGGAVVIAFVCSLFVAVFIVEFAPDWLRRVLEPVVRLLASVPSVIYGLLGVLVLVPLHRQPPDHPAREGLGGSDDLSSAATSLLAAVLILTVMIAPIMIAVFSDGLRAVPRGLDRGVAGARGQSLADVLEGGGADRAAGARRGHGARDRARAGGGGDAEHGVRVGVGFAPNPADGLIFFVEPSRPLAATIIRNTEELSSPPMKHTLYAIAAVLLFSAAMLSFIGWAVKQSMKRYGVVA